ncbi:MAG: dTDP-4-dehydrorhamnose 3,5-epimerase family protein [Thermoplasmata archaeon]|nr:dTDP-4-dehydrorhamnose 3,5-epimerase family protein [Thermoplasmata archaeon]
MSSLLPGVKVHDLTRLPDERGSFTEILRTDWGELLGEDRPEQLNLSMSFPGMIRAWHRHARGQVDYFIVVRGTMKICAYDDAPGSPTQGQVDEIVASSERPQVVRIPGHYWHGTKGLGTEPALTVYLVNRLYDRAHPDEERRSWNDPAILDPRTRAPFDWNRPPHR